MNDNPMRKLVEEHDLLKDANCINYLEVIAAFQPEIIKKCISYISKFSTEVTEANPNLDMAQRSELLSYSLQNLIYHVIMHKLSSNKSFLKHNTSIKSKTHSLGLYPILDIDSNYYGFNLSSKELKKRLLKAHNRQPKLDKALLTIHLLFVEQIELKDKNGNVKHIYDNTDNVRDNSSNRQWEVEHIWPQEYKKSTCWTKPAKVDAKIFKDRYINSLGNKILLDQEYNVSISNNCLKTKIESYEKSNIVNEADSSNIRQFLNALEGTYIISKWKKEIDKRADRILTDISKTLHVFEQTAK